MKLHAYLAGAALALAACAGAEGPEPLTISDVRVEADLTAVASRDAAVYWGNLADDLSTAIGAEFVGQTAAEGYVIDVDVDEIALANALNAGLGADDARLTGVVSLVNPLNEVVEQTYVVSASANQAAAFLPSESGSVAVSPSSAEFYSAVVRAFARGVGDAVRSGGVVAARAG
jgi:hypothetical protein